MSIKAILILSISLQVIVIIPSALSCMRNSGYPHPKFQWKRSPDPWAGVSSFSRIRSRMDGCACGKPAKLPSPGFNSSTVDNPWQALIRVHLNDNPSATGTTVKTDYYCGGTVINDLIILTSSQCVFRYDPGQGLIFNVNEEGRKVLPSQIKVWIGLTVRGLLVETSGLDVQKIIYHPSFPKSSEADVALLKLKSRIKLNDSDTTSPICLPFSTDIDRQNLYKPNSEVIGWFSPPNSNDSHNSLQEIRTNIASCPRHEHDQETGVQEGFNYRYYFCTPRYDKQDSNLYDMDTGSPLIVEAVDTRKFQLGILSWVAKDYIKDKFSKTVIATKNIRLFTRINIQEILSFIDHTSDVEGASWCEEPMIHAPESTRRPADGRLRTTTKKTTTKPTLATTEMSSSPRLETISLDKTTPNTNETSNTRDTTTHAGETTTHTTEATTTHTTEATTTHTTEATTTHTTEATTTNITEATTTHTTETTTHTTKTTSPTTEATSHTTETTSTTKTTTHTTETTSHATETTPYNGETTPHISERPHTNETTPTTSETIPMSPTTYGENSTDGMTNMTVRPPIYPIDWNDTSFSSGNRTTDPRCQCGKRSLNHKDRIFFGASDALPYEFPWQVLVIILPFGEQNKTYCSATVINSLLVLTSANCVTKTADNGSTIPYSTSEVTVKVNVYTNENDLSAERLAIDTIIVHPQYLISRNQTFENPFDYDIALIILQNHIPFADNDKFSPVCLPESQDIFRFDNDRVTTLAGWKITNFEEYPLVLGTMPILLHKDKFCRVNTWGSSERFLCGKGPNEDINSLSGGFLAVEMQSRNILLQIGVVSHKKTIWIKQKPSHLGYYSNVIKHLPFIDYVSFKEKAVWCKREVSLHEENSPDTSDSRHFGSNTGNFVGSKAEERKPWIWEYESSHNKVETRICEEETDLKFCNCGRRGTTSSVKKGHQAVHFEFPWHVHLTVASEDDKNSISYSCSSYIINSFVLITSANCVISAEGNIVDPSLMTAEFLVVDDFWEGPKFSIDKIMIHPGYLNDLDSSEITRKYDIALLKMKKPIEFKKKHYRPVCLPELGENIVLSGETVTLSLAWNRLTTLDNNITHRLLKDEHVLHDANYCDVHFNSSSTTICTDYTSGKAEAKEVDYGKGLFLPSARNSHMMLIGIASFRVSDNIRKDKFELEYFTKIDAFVPFINYYSNEWGASWCQRKFSFS